MIDSIQITETPSEYLVQIPPSQRERAKGIDGRRWDSVRKVWTFRKTRRTYESLIAEFGDDLHKLKPPDLDTESSKPIDVEGLHKKIENLETSLQTSLEKIIKVKSGDVKAEEKIKIFQNTLAEKESEIAEQKTKINELKAANKSEIEQLKNSNYRLSKKITDQAEQEHGETLEDAIKNLLIAMPGNNKIFEDALKEFGINEQFVTESQKKLTEYLKNILEKTESGEHFIQLIGEARDKELLNPLEHDLAHTVRKHRNTIQHVTEDPHTRRIRILYIVIAYALFWTRSSTNE